MEHRARKYAREGFKIRNMAEVVDVPMFGISALKRRATIKDNPASRKIALLRLADPILCEEARSNLREVCRPLLLITRTLASLGLNSESLESEHFR
jgi:hypothetical protein